MEMGPSRCLEPHPWACSKHDGGLSLCRLGRGWQQGRQGIESHRCQSTCWGREAEERNLLEGRQVPHMDRAVPQGLREGLCGGPVAQGDLGWLVSSHLWAGRL